MLLATRGLTVAYGAVKALQDVSIDVEQGKIVSIIGANGAGKSTLLKTISGMVPIQQGEITFEGKALPNAPHNIVKAGITHVPEGRRVFAGLTVAENLLMGGVTQPVQQSEQNMQRMYELFPILLERKNQQAGTLSGGEQQMLAIARGLMSQPKLLMLDEPSLGLAPIIVEQVFTLIASIRDLGYTVLLVEQNARQAMTLSEYTYVLENGRVFTHGLSSDLLQDEMIAAAYLGEKSEASNGNV